MMTTKEATKIAATFPLNLKAGELLTEIAKPGTFDEKDTDAITNAYRQRKADDDSIDLAAGDAILPKAVVTKKAKKKVVELAERNKNVKKATKKQAAELAARKPVKKAKTSDSPKPKKQGTIARQIELIMKGLDNATIVAKVNKEFGSHTTPSCVSWARSQMRKNPKKYGLKSASQVPASTPAVIKA